MTLLTIDTCTERLLVGLRTTGEPDRWANLDSQGNHARDLPAVVAELLGTGRPDAIGVALGPGSFTGVRIGLSTAKGLSEGWGVPLVGLDNLRAMADASRRLTPGGPVARLPIIDARKGRFYGGIYVAGEEKLAPNDLGPEDWLRAASDGWGPVMVTGYQGRRLAEALGPLPAGWSVVDTPDWSPELLDQSRDAWDHRRFLGPEAGPRYLRLSEAEEALRSGTLGVKGVRTPKG